MPFSTNLDLANPLSSCLAIPLAFFYQGTSGNDVINLCVLRPTSSDLGNIVRVLQVPANYLLGLSMV